ncbi:serine protease inhibitor Kazal-type 1-like isoform X2 [Gambusia affinis]|uniref:serine protease inhibitor Kazal-type 1-like isoform X1 n=1 Tax=Gambusia affinis TaxID=33528 RepID=UPI001CDCA9BE|nr:serine protease inhibitor Kazal-type 1-like isoform X1 [Gambusia affinis]XP_043970566.1 serine protease inhibitor Kazal-type 1-like isoform X2 [Gambusia affinis]
MTARPAVLGLLIICVAAVAEGLAPFLRTPKCADAGIWGCKTKMRMVCGSNGVTYANECLLCKALPKSKKYIVIAKDGPC